MALFKSRPEKIERVSPLRPGQEQLLQQQLGAISGPGAGGAFGEAADYWRQLLGGQGDPMREAPLMRQFQEDIIPQLAEQFAGMGSGALSSGGFRTELGRSSTDLAERLGAIRAGLRESAASNLSGLGQQGLSPVDELIFRPRQGSLFEQFAGSVGGGLGKGIGSLLASGGLGLLGGTLGGAAIGSGLGNTAGKSFLER